MMWSLTRAAKNEPSLVRACQAGDRSALKTLFLRHKDRVYSIALGILGDASAAEDATQDLFVRLPERLKGFRGDAALTTFLHKATVNLCYDELRRRKRTNITLPTPENADELAQWIERRELHEALARLPENLRTPIALRYFEDLSYDELAEALKIAPGTVASRLHRGLKLLAKELSENQ
jgi:RNA polymerase sigma-70 factor, ECF subfamily